jgi:protein phosphatase
MSISFLVGRTRIRFAGRTDVGRVRSHNEDHLLVPREMALGIVADGMGGHACGEVASEIAVTTIDAYYQRTGEEGLPNWPLRLPRIQIERDRMTTAIKLANSKIHETGQADAAKKGMGTTVQAIFFDQGRVYVGHVGDSRAYRLRKGELTQVTEDHSLLNDYRRMKEMSPEEVRNFAHKNVVVRALGLAEHVSVDVVVDQFQEGDCYLLCSDGLNDMIDDDRIAAVLKSTESLDTAAAALIDAANEAGGKDNVTALLARVEHA